jgi:hypothetical protein
MLNRPCIDTLIKKFFHMGTGKFSSDMEKFPSTHGSSPSLVPYAFEHRERLVSALLTA